MYKAFEPASPPPTLGATVLSGVTATPAFAQPGRDRHGHDVAMIGCNPDRHDNGRQQWLGQSRPRPRRGDPRPRAAAADRLSVRL